MSRAAPLFLISPLVLASLACLPSFERRACYTHADCPEGFVCAASVCRSKGTESPDGGPPAATDARLSDVEIEDALVDGGVPPDSGFDAGPERDGASFPDVDAGEIEDTGGCFLQPETRSIATTDNEPMPSVVWTGSEFGIAYAEFKDSALEVYIARVGLDGLLPAAPYRVRTTTIGFSHSPALAWMDGAYGLVYTEQKATKDLRFVRVESDGRTVSAGPIVFSGAVEEPDRPSLLFANNQLSVAWYSANSSVLYFTRMSPRGVVGATVPHRLGDQPFLTKGPPGSDFTIVANLWAGDTGAREVHFYALNSDGTVLQRNHRLTWSTGESRFPSLAFTGQEFGLVWVEENGSNGDAFFRRLSSTGMALSSTVTLSNAPSESRYSEIIWNSDRAEFAVVWDEVSGNAGQVRFARIGSDGRRLSADLTVSATPGLATRPRIVWTGDLYAIVWQLNRVDESGVYLRTVECGP